jgi:hypothetical protein
MRGHLILAACLSGAFLSPLVAFAEGVPPQLQVAGSAWPLQGHGTATYLFFRVYDAGLYAPQQLSPDDVLNAESARALVLNYRQTISAEEIRQASNQVLLRQLSATEWARLKPALNALDSSMQGVRPGDTYTLIWQPPRLTLSFNQKTVFSRDDADLARAYFGIWLGASPLSDSLKNALLAETPKASAQ